MAIEKKEVEYAKESGDVMVFTVKLVKTIKEKGDYMSVMSELVNAVNGIDGSPEEFKANRKAAIATVSYHVGELVDAFLPSAE